MAWELKKDSSHKLIAWFNDGNSVTRYSLDWKHKYSKNYDPDLGLAKLRDLVNDYGTNARIACIYEYTYGRNDGKEIEKYSHGIKITTII